MRGSNTDPLKIEQGIQKAVELGSINAGAREVGLAPQTLYDNIKSDDEIVKLRIKRIMEYCDRATPILNKLLTALDLKTEDVDKMSRQDLKSLTGAISDIRKSMDTAINIIQLNQFNDNRQINYTHEDIKKDIIMWFHDTKVSQEDKKEVLEIIRKESE